MPRLQILHHKSYHPYLEKNKQRVREDEARAAAEELAKEQKSIDAEAENRLSLLRRRAGSPSFQADEGDLPSTSSARDPGKSLLERHREKKAKEEKRERKKRDRLDFDFPSETARRNKGKEKERERYDDEESVGTGKWETGGHLNFFADLEKDPKLNKPQPTLAELAKAKKDQESDPFTLYLGRPDKETKPWYADKDLKRVEEKEVGDEADERRERDRRKDARSKNRNDPLTHISTLLSTSTSSSRSRSHHHHHHTNGHHKPSNPTEARRSRETSERERALALIAKSKAPQRTVGGWDDTPSSAGGRSWAEEWEREQAKAGRRFFERDERPRPNGGRSWEV